MQDDILEPVLGLGVPVLLQRQETLFQPLSVDFAASDKAPGVSHEHAVEARAEEVDWPWSERYPAEVRRCNDVWRREERRQLVC